MRTEKSIKNTIVSVISMIVTMLIGFVAQKVFLNVMGTEVLGINGLFTNIISVLSIAELGIGPAIVCNLYKPIADKDTEKIKSLLGFYKKSYTIIAAVVVGRGIVLLPFLDAIVGAQSINFSIH